MTILLSTTNYMCKHTLDIMFWLMDSAMNERFASFDNDSNLQKERALKEKKTKRECDACSTFVFPWQKL